MATNTIDPRTRARALGVKNTRLPRNRSCTFQSPGGLKPGWTELRPNAKGEVHYQHTDEDGKVDNTQRERPTQPFYVGITVHSPRKDETTPSYRQFELFYNPVERTIHHNLSGMKTVLFDANSEDQDLPFWKPGLAVTVDVNPHDYTVTFEVEGQKPIVLPAYRPGQHGPQLPMKHYGMSRDFCLTYSNVKYILSHGIGMKEFEAAVKGPKDTIDISSCPSGVFFTTLLMGPNQIMRIVEKPKIGIPPRSKMVPESLNRRRLQGLEAAYAASRRYDLERRL